MQEQWITNFRKENRFANKQWENRKTSCVATLLSLLPRTVCELIIVPYLQKEKEDWFCLLHDTKVYFIPLGSSLEYLACHVSLQSFPSKCKLLQLCFDVDRLYSIWERYENYSSRIQIYRLDLLEENPVWEHATQHKWPQNAEWGDWNANFAISEYDGVLQLWMLSERQPTPRLFRTEFLAPSNWTPLEMSGCPSNSVLQLVGSHGTHLYLNVIFGKNLFTATAKVRLKQEKLRAHFSKNSYRSRENISPSSLMAKAFKEQEAAYFAQIEKRSPKSLVIRI